LAERCVLDGPTQGVRREPGQVSPPLGSVDRAEHPRPQRDLDRVLVPAAGDAGATAADRELQLLAGRVQPAGRAVEAVEDDPLQGRVDPAGAALAGLAWVGDLRRRMAQRAL